MGRKSRKDGNGQGNSKNTQRKLEQPVCIVQEGNASFRQERCQEPIHHRADLGD
jgi:hypothetical protein